MKLAQANPNGNGDASTFNIDRFLLEINRLSSENGYLDAKQYSSIEEKLASKYGFTHSKISPRNMVQVLTEYIADVKSNPNGVGAKYANLGRQFFLDLGGMIAKKKSLEMAIRRRAMQSREFGRDLGSDADGWALAQQFENQQRPDNGLEGQLQTIS